MDSTQLTPTTDDIAMLRSRVAELEAQFEARGIAMQKWVRRYEAEHAARVAAERALVRCIQFMAQTAQDLHTPLATLVEHAQQLDRSIKEDLWVARQERVSSAAVIKHAMHLAKLIEQLRDMTDAQHSQLGVRRERLDLVRLVRRAIETFHPILTQRTLTDTPGPLIIVGDRLRLEEALHTLLEYAVRHSPHGKAVFVHLEREPTGVRLVIHNRGSETPSELPEGFSHPESLNTNSRSESAARLHIVDQIVTLHGGSLEVESKEGIGSTVTVRLPLAP